MLGGVLKKFTCGAEAEAVEEGLGSRRPTSSVSDAVVDGEEDQISKVTMGWRGLEGSGKYDTREGG